MGFEYFYGFMGGETDQWTPYLFRDHTQIFPWVGRPGYNLTTDMADDAIKYLRTAQCCRARQAVFPLLRPGRHACTASAHAGVDQEDQRHALVRQGLERSARADFREPEEARRDPGRIRNSRPGRMDSRIRRRQVTEMGNAQRRRKEALHSSGGCLCRLRGLHRP